MTKQNGVSAEDWLSNCGGWSPSHNLEILRRGIELNMLDNQDEYGMTALSSSVMSAWMDGVEELLRARANTELRYFRTGETALHLAVQERNEPIIASLVAAGADPDARNHWGITPRAWASRDGATYFNQLPIRDNPLPAPLIQNAEHLADHYHPRFKIPKRKEREILKVGQAVDLYVYGPKAKSKQDTVKVRITATSGQTSQVRYVGAVETPIERTHLTDGTTMVEFGPENIASVYVARPTKKKK